jgi:hypothetical protein
LLFQEAGRLAHRHSLGAVDRRQSRLVDSDTPPQCVELLAPGDEPLRFTGHLLGIDRVGVHASHRCRFGVACPLHRLLALAYLRLEALARPRVRRHRAQRLQGGRLLLHLESGLVAQAADFRIVLAGQQRLHLDL